MEKIMYYFFLGEDKSCAVDHKTLKTGGYQCNGTCINNNIGYQNWSMAWEMCKQVEACSRIIFTWENGSYYSFRLRKEDDIFDNDPTYLHVDIHPDCKGRILK